MVVEGGVEGWTEGDLVYGPCPFSEWWVCEGEMLGRMMKLKNEEGIPLTVCCSFLRLVL